jgi:hypothetical protein
LVLSPVSDEPLNCGGFKMEIGDVEVGENSVEVQGNRGVEEIVEKIVGRAQELTKKKAPAAGASPPTQSPNVMMANTGFETQGTELDGAQTVWKFNFCDLFVEING